MDEAIYFSHQGVSVSNSRFIINDKTISIRSVSTVERRVLKPKLGFACACIIVGMALLLTSGGMSMIGILSVICGGILWFLAKPKYSVVIHTPAGECQAFVSENSLDVDNVLTALNVAIALKGDTRLS